MTEREYRQFSICESDIRTIEEVLYALYRHGETDLALKLMVFALRMRTGTGFSPELPTNVVQLPVPLHSVKA